MDIEGIFMQDVREKRKAANGVYHRASRRGYIRGGVKTQSDFMSKKEKNKLNGEVKVYNMYDKYAVIENVPQINEIEKMDYSERVNLYKFLKGRYSNTILQKHWLVSSGTLYNKVYQKYNLYTPRVTKSSPKTKGLYNNINEIPSINTILEMASSQRKGILTAAKQQFPVIELSKYWNISKYKLYSIYNDNNILTQGKDNKKIEKEIAITVDDEEKNISTQQIDTDVFNQLVETINSLKDVIKKDNGKSETNNTGFTIEINGQYNKKELENKLLSISNILGDEKSYKVSLKIEEI